MISRPRHKGTSKTSLQKPFTPFRANLLHSACCYIAEGCRVQAHRCILALSKPVRIHTDTRHGSRSNLGFSFSTEDTSDLSYGCCKSCKNCSQCSVTTAPINPKQNIWASFHESFLIVVLHVLNLKVALMIQHQCVSKLSPSDLHTVLLYLMKESSLKGEFAHNCNFTHSLITTVSAFSNPQRRSGRPRISRPSTQSRSNTTCLHSVCLLFDVGVRGQVSTKRNSDPLWNFRAVMPIRKCPQNLHRHSGKWKTSVFLV